MVDISRQTASGIIDGLINGSITLDHAVQSWRQLGLGAIPPWMFRTGDFAGQEAANEPARRLRDALGQSATSAASPVLSTRELQEELSAERSGRAQLFNQFLAAQPQMTPLAQNFLARQFDPQSAQFALSQATSPQVTGNFADFLRGGQNVNFNQGFNQLQGIFGGGASPEQQTVAQQFTDRPEVARNLIGSAFSSQFNPFLRNAAGSVANRRIGQFEAGDLETPIFQAFLRSRQFGGGGGGGFFGGFN